MKLQLATVREDYAVSAQCWVKPKLQIEINTTGWEKMELHTVFGEDVWRNRVSGTLDLLLVALIPPALFLSQRAS